MINRLAMLLGGFALVAAAQTSSFPGTPTTDAQLKVQVNGRATLLSASMNASVTSATVASCTGIPANSLATVNTEIIAIANCSGNTLTLATASPGCSNGRACDGTTAATHSAGATLSLFVDAWHHNALRVEVEAIEASLGVGGSPTFANVTATGGMIAPVFNCSATGGSNCIQQASGTFAITGAGNASFQTIAATSTINSLATGATAAFQQNTGTFSITGAGNASFQTVAATSTFNSLATGTTAAFQQNTGSFVISGNGNAAFQRVDATNGFRSGASQQYGLDGSGVLTVSSCTGCGGGGGGGVTTFNTRTGAVTLLAADVTAAVQDLRATASPTWATPKGTVGMIAPVFNCSATGATNCMQQASGNFTITGAGNASFQTVAATSTVNSLATGATAAFQQSTGTFVITGAGNANFQSVSSTNGYTVGPYGLNSAGLLTVASCSGCGGGGGGGVTTFNTRSGAVTLLATDVTTAVQNLTTTGSPTFSTANASAGMVAPVFNCSATGATNCMQQASGNFTITGAGNASFQTVAATSTINSLATGATAAFQQNTGTFVITGAGNASFQALAVTNTYTAGGSVGITGSTCSSFKGGICIAP